MVSPTVTSIAADVAALTARVAALETWRKGIDAQVAQNAAALRAVLTLLHPDPAHPVMTDSVTPRGVWLHSLVMQWLEAYGGRLTPT